MRLGPKTLVGLGLPAALRAIGRPLTPVKGGGGSDLTFAFTFNGLAFTFGAALYTYGAA